MRSIVRIIVTLTLVAIAGPAFAASWFVDQATGDDGNDGSLLAPFATVTRALAVAGDMDVIQVGPGVYGPSSGETFPLATFEISITIEGAGRTQTILDGEGEAQVLSLQIGEGRSVRIASLAVVDGGTAIGAGIFVGDPGHLEIAEVHFEGNAGAIGGALHYQINADHDAELLVVDCTFRENTASIGPGIHVQQNGTGDHTLQVLRSTLQGHDDAAIAVSRNNGGGQIIVRNSIIDAGQELAISVPVTAVDVLNSTLVGSRALIRGGDGLRVVNSILVAVEEPGGDGDPGDRDDKGIGPTLVEGDGGIVRDSLVHPANVDGHTFGPNIVDADPQLTARLRLDENSPAIDQGDNSIIDPEDRDIDGDSRILPGLTDRGLGRVDLGADEYDPRVLLRSGFEEIAARD